MINMIKDFEMIPIALPLKNILRHAEGSHPGYFVFTIIRITSNSNFEGYGEIGGGGFSFKPFEKFVKNQIIGEELNIRKLRYKIASPVTSKYYNQLLPQIWFGIETALIDLKGKIENLNAGEILGGRLKNKIKVSGYIFPTENLETPEEFSNYTKNLVNEFGFDVIKLKAGVFNPSHEVEVIKNINEMLPKLRFRIDANGAWNLSDAIYVAERLSNVPIEYFEDPVWSMMEMKKFREMVNKPLATNTCVTNFDDVANAFIRNSVDIILGDPHWWYGAFGYLELSSIASSLGLEIGMHSPGETGIGLSAMLHAASAAFNLSYAIDTHYIHLKDDIIKNPYHIKNGYVEVPNGPGLGIEIDSEKMEKYSSFYEENGDYIYTIDQLDKSFFVQLPHIEYRKCKCGHTRW